MTRPDPMTFAIEADADGWLSRQRPSTTAYCGGCSTRLGFVYDTEHGPLWLGFLGSRRDHRQVRSAVFTEAGSVSDGRVMVGQWVDRGTPWYMCDCKCQRNSAAGDVVNEAVYARRSRINVPRQV